jgi:hypothetical protein
VSLGAGVILALSFWILPELPKSISLPPRQ